MEPASVILSLRFNRVAAATLALAAVVTTASPLYAQARNNEAAEEAKEAGNFPTARDLAGLTVSGSYLAARHASVDRDAGAASAFYRAALRADPKNTEL